MHTCKQHDYVGKSLCPICEAYRKNNKIIKQEKKALDFANRSAAESRKLKFFKGIILGIFIWVALLLFWVLYRLILFINQ